MSNRRMFSKPGPSNSRLQPLMEIQLEDEPNIRTKQEKKGNALPRIQGNVNDTRATREQLRQRLRPCWRRMADGDLTRTRIQRDNALQRTRQNEHGESFSGDVRRNDGANQSRNRKLRGNTHLSGLDDKLSFKTLEDIANTATDEVYIKINNHRTRFMNSIKSPLNKHDLYAIFIKILTKLCTSAEYDQLKWKIMLEVCHSGFICNLQTYLLELPYATNKLSNNMYWEKPTEFWINFITLLDYITTRSPSLAIEKLRTMIDIISQSCLDRLEEKHAFRLEEDQKKRLEEVRVKLRLIEKKQENVVKIKGFEGDDSDPPEDFRDLNIIPTREELLEERPFLRANVVAGGYRDIEHYLDIQFRLLREDCFGPLREGLLQYVKEPHKRKYDNIRVYRDVKFVQPHFTADGIGFIVQLNTDIKSNNYLKRIRWANSKRFMFGSLLLFTRDDCKSFSVATVMDRKYISDGKLAITILDKTQNTYFMDDSFVMIESDVYFEPYRHVLKALQNPDFPRHLAMAKYIVHVNPEPNPPAYLHPGTEFTVNTSSKALTTFTVLDSETWPTKEDLGFNESQYEAYKLALTHEFVVIQGPPGTGKTFLGVKVAEALLKNLEFNRSCYMLVICYTNHALDQFLENILPITESVVRIGGRSRSEAMDKINLNQLRRERRDNNYNRRLMTRKTHEYKEDLARLQKEYEQLDYISNGVISYNTLIKYVPETSGFFKTVTNQDPLLEWLFEVCDKMNYQDVDIDEDDQAVVAPVPLEDTDDASVSRKHNMFQDDDNAFDDDESHKQQKKQLRSKFVLELSFSIEQAHSAIKNLSANLKKNRHSNDKDSEYIKYRIFLIQSRIKLFKEMSVRKRTKIHIHQRMNLWMLPPFQRWDIYFDWIQDIVLELKQKISYLENIVKIDAEQYKDAKMLVDLDLLSNVTVIGMTTTGAAMWRDMLENIAPPIVIIEEAAEVLEQHIVTSLTKGCQHLILIGDHQQLRPSVSNMKLARKAKIDVSLFERMIGNSIHSKRLTVQHRMRPEIASLISPHIYPDLENHSSVEVYPPVRGVQHNLFFFTHEFKEEARSEEDNASRSNIQEADMVLHFASYLMKQGYEPSDVTILAAYTGQLFYMKKKKNEFHFLDGVKITVVDNYQGEESKIILLSLVRNNEKNEIGFLSIENRICVALSRAREGFYIFGNMETLKKKTEIWQKISDTLECHESIGNSLALRCENHSDQKTVILTVDDFSMVPEGGCLLNCIFERSCGHKCRKLCHGYDTDHETQCPEKCERTCEGGHPCKSICGKECEPCKVKVLKDLPCGHSKEIFCHLRPDEASIKCSDIVKATLPCGHENEKQCHSKVEDVTCQTQCPYRVECGHSCLRKCHVKDDPHHEKYECQKPCAKTKMGCVAGLESDFGDHQCQKKCYESCDNCDVMVTKLIPNCNHKMKMQCHMEAVPALCVSKCERTLLCGHICSSLCSKTCDTMKCTEMRVETVESPCGHQVTLPCNIFRSVDTAGWNPNLPLKWCKQPCKKELQCGHMCSGTCSKCLQGRIHAPCLRPCSKIQLCGHACKQPCNAVCPPCPERCIVKCQHSKCNKSCGALCAPCKEDCIRSCRHGKCKRRCDEPCLEGACSEPCRKKMKCGHTCRGVCSEPCLRVCKTCHPQHYPVDTLITGEPYEDDAVLIQLEDCKHIFDVKCIDDWVFLKREEISLPTCPLCKTPINNNRYQNHLKTLIKKEINPIKLKIFGTKNQIKDLLKEVKSQTNLLKVRLGKVLREVRLPWAGAFNDIKNQINGKSQMSLPELETVSINLNILKHISECYENCQSVLKEELNGYIKTIISVVQVNSRRISVQQQLDIQNEMKRLDAIVHLSKITTDNEYLTIHAPEVKEAVQNVRKCVFCLGVYSNAEAILKLKKIQEMLKFPILLKQQREMIVKAVGVKVGAWYKCPNGHIYCIADCGGATTVGKCIECGAAVGGRNHELLSNNRHASEMDGSRFPAWSEQNNMANFDIDDID